MWKLSDTFLNNYLLKILKQKLESISRGWHVGVVGLTFTCDTGIPDGPRFWSWILHFQFNSLMVAWKGTKHFNHPLLFSRVVRGEMKWKWRSLEVNQHSYWMPAGRLKT